jgi:SAM-dependent methyltransferase
MKGKSISNNWDLIWEEKLSPDTHDLLIDLVKKYSPGKKILEVGFGTAGDLCLLNKLGFDCYGLELSRVAYKNAMKNKELKIFFGDGEKTRFASNQFDLIFHQGVLEHFRNPECLIKEHRRILKDGGVVVVDIPHKWNLFTLYKKYFQFFGKWYGGWERSYSSYELRDLIERNGFLPLGIFYRGIFPHQWGKFLFPHSIVNNKVVKRLLTKTPFRFIQKFARLFYGKSRLMQIVSSYNIIIVARKK